MKSKIWLSRIILLTFLIQMLFSALPIDMEITKMAGATPLSGFTYYKEITVTNKIDDYASTIMVWKDNGHDDNATATVDTEGHCQNDFDDIRFAYSNGTQLNYWIENYTSGTAARFWFKNHCNASTIYIYYGNATCGNTSNGENTIPFFDGFDDSTTYTDDWTVDTGGGTWSQGSGIISQTAASGSFGWGTNKGIYVSSPPTAVDNRSVRAKMRLDDTSGQHYIGISSKMLDANNILHTELRREATNVTRDVARMGGSWESPSHDAAFTIAMQTWYIIETKIRAVSPSSVKTDIDNANKLDFSDADWYRPTWDGLALCTYNSKASWDWILIRPYVATEPSFGFKTEHSGEWQNTEPTFAGWSPTGTGESLQPNGNVTIFDEDGNSTNVWIYQSLNNVTWGTAVNTTTGHVANTSFNFKLTTATGYSTKYYIKCSANDSNSNSTKYWNFTTIYEVYSPGGVIIPFILEDRTTYNGSAFGDVGDTIVFDEENNQIFVFYFDESDCSQFTSLCVKRLWLSNNTWDEKFEFDNSLYKIGESWNDEQYYELHISVQATLDKSGYIWIVYGGHIADSIGYHMASVRSSFPISSENFDYKLEGNWGNPVNITVLNDDSCYQELHVSVNNTYCFWVRDGHPTTSNARERIFWSFDNGATWNSRIILNADAYSNVEWFFDQTDGEDKLFVQTVMSKGGVWNDKESFFWLTLNDTIANNGAYTSQNDTSDLCYYTPGNSKFPIDPDDIISQDRFYSTYDVPELKCAVAFDEDTQQIYVPISYSNSSDAGVRFANKTIGTANPWTVTTVTDTTYHHQDYEWVNNSLFVMASKYLDGTNYGLVYGYSNTPTNVSSWEFANITSSTTINQNTPPLFCSFYHSRMVADYDGHIFFSINVNNHVIDPLYGDARDQFGATWDYVAVMYLTYTIYYPPELSNPSPENAASGINPSQSGDNITLSIDIEDNNSNMTLEFWTNASGSWAMIASGENLTNGTYEANATGGMDDYSTKYWWSANCTDINGSQQWTNETYYFTTRGAFEPSIPELSVVAYNCTSIAVNASFGETTYSDKIIVRRKLGGYPTGPTDGTEVYNSSAYNNTWYFDDGLNYYTTYYYRAWAYNITDHMLSGYASDSDTTYRPPNTPTLTHPANGETNVEKYLDSPYLNWSCTDPYSGDLTYDVYLATSSPPTTKVISNGTTVPPYNPGALSYNTKYYWKVVAWNEYGGKNTSSIYNFTTRASPPTDSVKNENLSIWYPYIQEALADPSIASGHRILVYENYTVDENVFVNHSVSVEGVGDARIFFISANVSNVMISNFTVETYAWVKEDNVDIVNCTFNCTAYDIYTSSFTSNTHINNCTFTEGESNITTPAVFGSVSNYIYIENCTFYDFTDMTALGLVYFQQNNHIYIKNNTFYGSKRKFIQIENANAVYIEDNTLINNISSGTYYSISFGTVSNLTFRGNTIVTQLYGISFSTINTATIYDNFFNASSGHIVPLGLSGVAWNITKTLGTNIIGGPYLGGNYWNDYTGSDTDDDGLGDTNYEVMGGQVDYHPLVYYNYDPVISDESPEDGTEGQPTAVSLSVNISDQDGDTVTVYFFNASGDALIGSDEVEGNGTASVNWGSLGYGAQYNWYVYANDSHGNNISSSTWHFHTLAYNPPPSVYLIYPYKNWQSIEQNPYLTFNVSDTDAIWAKLYRSTNNATFTLISESWLTTGNWSVQLGDSSLNTKFYWKVCATNNNVTWTNTSVWNFTTRAVNEPTAPYNGTIVPYNATYIAVYWDKGQAADKTIVVRNNASEPTGPTDGWVMYNGTFDGDWWWDYNCSANHTYYYALFGWNNTGGVSDDQIQLNETAYDYPIAPHTPSPSNGATGQPKANVNLSWACADPDRNGFAITTYMIYFGVASNPGWIANTTNKYYNTGSLNYNTKYYWKIVCINNMSDSNASSTWNFTTETGPTPKPDAPSNVVTWVNYSAVHLNWTKGTGADKTLVRYSASNPGTWTVATGTLVYNGTANNTYKAGLNPHTTYYFALWSWNTSSGYSLSYVATSRTTLNHNPNTPSSPSPANASASVTITSIISWACSDADSDSLTYTVFFGTDSTPDATEIVSSNQSGTSYDPPGNLAYNTVYYWKIVAYDAYGGVAAGPIWHFTTITETNHPPYQPYNQGPANESTGVSFTIVVNWTGGDPDLGDVVTYDVYFGTDSTPDSGEKVASNQSGITYDPGTLTLNVTYYWMIIAWDDSGEYNASGIWHFKVRGNTAPVVSMASPANGSINISFNPFLSVTVSDINNDTINISVYTNATGPSWVLISTHYNKNNGTYISYPTSMTSYNHTYYWKVYLVDELGLNLTVIYHFKTITTGSGYTIEIRYEYNATFVALGGNRTFNLTSFFDDDMIFTNVSSNPMNINYTNVPLLMRLYVEDTDANVSYSRSLIPDNASGIITFYIPFNASEATIYFFLLDDKTGTFSQSNSYLKTYLKVNGSEQVINEDYWSIDMTTLAFLTYESKYYTDVINTDGDVYTGWVEADLFCGPALKTISIYEVAFDEIKDITEFMNIAFYLDNMTSFVVFNYEADSGTNYADITIYRLVNSTRVLVFTGNYSSDNFYFSTPTNKTYLHIAFVNVSNDNILRPSTHLMKFTLKALPITYSPGWDDINTNLQIVYGATALNYAMLILAFFIVAIAFAFGPKLAGAGMIVTGAFLIFVNVVLGFVAVSTGIGILFVVLGAIIVVPREVGL